MSGMLAMVGQRWEIRLHGDPRWIPIQVDEVIGDDVLASFGEGARVKLSQSVMLENPQRFRLVVKAK
jgi:hypothetical protein